MIKSTVKDKEEMKPIIYPLLRKKKSNDLIVLFDSPDSGTVVWALDTDIHSVGAYSRTWNPELYETLPTGFSVQLIQD